MDARGSRVVITGPSYTRDVDGSLLGVVDVWDQVGDEGQWARVSRLLGGTDERLGDGLK